MLCSQQWNTLIHNSRNLWNNGSARNASLLRFFLHGTTRVGPPISRISRRREGGKRAREEITDNPPFQASKGKKEGGGDSHPWDPNFSTVPPPLPTISQKMQPDIVRWPPQAPPRGVGGHGRIFLESVAAAAATQHALKGVEINFLLHSLVLRRWGFFYSTVFEIVLLHRFIYQVKKRGERKEVGNLCCVKIRVFSQRFSLKRKRRANQSEPLGLSKNGEKVHSNRIW